MNPRELLPKAFRRRIRKMRRFLQNVRPSASWFSIIKYGFTPNGVKVRILVDGVPLTIRKGTPDFRVAASCLGGEFEDLTSTFPRSFSGTIVDAGAYIGASSIAFARAYPYAKVISIEPSKENFNLLLKNTRPYPNVAPLRAALVGVERTSVPLFDRQKGPWGFTTVADSLDVDQQEILESTPSITLSRLLEEGPIDAMKLDIEGGEKEIFDNDQDRLARIPYLVVELHDRIIPGCTASFMGFSSARRTYQADGEKMVSRVG